MSTMVAGGDQVTMAIRTDAPSHAAEGARSLGGLFVGGIAWTAAARWTAQVISWAATLMVARLLDPADYGVVAMATVFTGFVAVISEFGVGMTAITLRRLTSEQLAQLNGLAVLVGAGCCAASFAMAPAVARFYARPELRAITGVLATTFLSSGLRTIPAALLQRGFRYRPLAIVETAQALIGSGIALAAAAAGYGYWALVLSTVFASAAWTGALLLIAPCRIAWPRRIVLAETLAFTRQQLVGNSAWYFYSNADFVVAGRLLGARELGTYSVAWSFARIIPERLASIAIRVAPTFLAAVRDDPPRLCTWVYTLAEATALATFPLLIGVAITAPDLVRATLGNGWDAAVTPLRLLAVYGAFDAAMQLVTRGLVAVGDVRFTATVGLVLAAVMPVAFVVGAAWGPVGIALAWLAVAPPCRAALLLRARQSFQLNLADYAHALWPAVSATAVMTATVLAARAVTQVDTAAARALAAAVVGGVSYVAALQLLQPARTAVWVRRVRQALAGVAR